MPFMPESRPVDPDMPLCAVFCRSGSPAAEYTVSMDAFLSSFSLVRQVTMAVCLATAATTAMAQWQWIDGSGSRVFSDTPPPAGTPEKNILKRPGGERVRVPAAAEASPAAPATPAAPPVKSGKDKELEARKKQAEEAEAAKLKAEQDRFAKARAENCERAKRAKATFDSGVRIATTNTKGEREIMDDKARASESRRLDDIIRSDCGPLPAQGTGQ